MMFLKIFLYLYYCEEGGRKETNKTTEKKDNRQKSSAEVYTGEINQGTRKET